MGSQYSSHYLGTWCIQHYYRLTLFIPMFFFNSQVIRIIQSNTSFLLLKYTYMHGYMFRLIRPLRQNRSKFDFVQFGSQEFTMLKYDSLWCMVNHTPQGIIFQHCKLLGSKNRSISDFVIQLGSQQFTMVKYYSLWSMVNHTPQGIILQHCKLLGSKNRSISDFVIQLGSQQLTMLKYYSLWCMVNHTPQGIILQHCELLGSQLYTIKFGSVLRQRPDDGSTELKHVALYISVF